MRAAQLDNLFLLYPKLIQITHLDELEFDKCNFKYNSCNQTQLIAHLRQEFRSNKFYVGIYGNIKIKLNGSIKIFIYHWKAFDT